MTTLEAEIRPSASELTINDRLLVVSGLVLLTCDDKDIEAGGPSRQNVNWESRNNPTLRIEAKLIEPYTDRDYLPAILEARLKVEYPDFGAWVHVYAVPCDKPLNFDDPIGHFVLKSFEEYC